MEFAVFVEHLPYLYRRGCATVSGGVPRLAWTGASGKRVGMLLLPKLEDKLTRMVRKTCKTPDCRELDRCFLGAMSCSGLLQANSELFVSRDLAGK